MSDQETGQNPANSVIEASGQVIEEGGGGDPPRGGGGEGPPKRATKLTKVEYEHRLTEIYRLLVIGVSKQDIRRFVAEKTTWNVPERTLERYIQKATEWFKAVAATHRETELGKGIARCTDLFSRCHRIQDYKTALAAQKELHALLGLYPHREDGEGDGRDFVVVIPQGPQTDEEFEAKACQLLQRPPKVIN